MLLLSGPPLSFTPASPRLLAPHRPLPPQNADQLGIVALSREVKALALKARDNKLKPEVRAGAGKGRAKGGTHGTVKDMGGGEAAGKGREEDARGSGGRGATQLVARWR